MRQKITVFRLAVLADCFLRAGSRTAVMGGSFCFCLAAGVDFPMVFTVMLPVAQYAGVVIRVLFAIFKGFRSLFAADSAGLVIDRFFCAGCSRFQVLFFCLFCREVMRQKITVFRLAVLADCFLCTGGCAAMAVVRFRMLICWTAISQTANCMQAPDFPDKPRGNRIRWSRAINMNQLAQ